MDWVIMLAMLVGLGLIAWALWSMWLPLGPLFVGTTLCMIAMAAYGGRNKGTQK